MKKLNVMENLGYVNVVNSEDVDVLNELIENGYCGYIQDSIHEVIDGNINIYYSDLIKNYDNIEHEMIRAIEECLINCHGYEEEIKSNLRHMSFNEMENYLNELLDYEGIDINIYSLIQCGEYQYYIELFSDNYGEVILNYAINYINENDIDIEDIEELKDMINVYDIEEFTEIDDILDNM